jgi:L-ascorbate metabolism protein UlaG (beta-lactamase superfamily)
MRLPSSDAATSGRSASLFGLKLMWLGHSTFLATSPKGVRVLFDPWITTNPSCPPSARKPGAVDLMLISHGHSDHCEDAVSVARDTGATVVAPFELVSSLERQGVKNTRPMNIGGRQSIHGIDITMVNAVHTISATGYIVRFEDGPVIYFAGDTALFGDMRLIGERYRPDIAFLPIGDRYTMGPEDAAIAADWLGVRTIVPMHYGTFPELTGTPEQLRQFIGSKGIDVIELRPGEVTS